MSRISRRSVVTTGASAGLLFAAPQWATPAAAQQKAYTRYNATSTQGKAMLKIYEKAVGDMMNKIPKGDPRNWDFQWYSHWIPGPQSPWSAVVAEKTKTIQATYGSKPPTDPHRKLAQAMWDDCQAHGNNPNDPSQYQEPLFLPWHRYFVYYFEQIIRNVAQNADFTLPYWNYLGGPSSNRVIPPEFRVTTSPLYRSNRNPGVNAGGVIDQGAGRTPLNSDAFNETSYIKTVSGSEVGFCPMLDSNPHGAVHVDVGNQSNMGRIPNAAGAPVFWLHHCEIDRLWESWNRLPGRPNPAWPSRTFVYANGSGGAVLAPVAGADRVALLGYQYDNYYVPPGISPAAAVSSQLLAAAPSEVKGLIDKPLMLGAAPVRAMMALPAPALNGALTTMRLTAPAGRRNLYLVLTGIMMPEDPGDIVYHVYLDLPEGAKATPEDPHYIGTLSFFHITVGNEHGGTHHSSAAFNVTNVVRKLQQQKGLSSQASVTLIPSGESKAKEQPMVSAIELVES